MDSPACDRVKLGRSFFISGLFPCTTMIYCSTGNFDSFPFATR